MLSVNMYSETLDLKWLSFFPGANENSLWPSDSIWQHRTPGRVLPLCWVIWMCRRFDPLFWHSGDWTWSFGGTFSHPPTPKLSFGVLKLPILTEFDLFGPKFYFSLDLFGSNFQRPAAHPHQFSDIELGQHSLSKWLVVWRHYAITWTSVDLSPLRSCDIHIRKLIVS